MSERTDLQVTAALLRQGRRLHGLSLAMLGVVCLWALAAWAMQNSLAAAAWWLGASAVAGMVQVYWALRTDFDADLFEIMSKRENLQQAASDLDASLRELGLIRGGGEPRDWSSRLRGAGCLLCWQAVSAAIQAVLLILAIYGG
ncbi:MAG: hypothetical protein LBL59_09935 [Xanthomonadaceae bacterium]|jgi:hypothetical protein|nr:hypothetical protein [Xanthomonadaceae bacterium]